MDNEKSLAGMRSGASGSTPAPGSPEAVAAKLAWLLRAILPTIKVLAAGQGIRYNPIDMAEYYGRIVAALEDYDALRGQPAPAKRETR